MPTKKQLEEADRLIKNFDWSKYDAMSDEEIRQHWAWDKDMTWPTDKELAEFDLVLPAKARRERELAAKGRRQKSARPSKKRSEAAE